MCSYSLLQGSQGRPRLVAATRSRRFSVVTSPAPTARLSATLQVSPQQLQVVGADFAAPRRHALAFAVQHRALKAREVVLREFAQVEGHSAEVDHILAMARDAKLLVDVTAELGVVGQRQRRCQ